MDKFQPILQNRHEPCLTVNFPYSRYNHWYKKTLHHYMLWFSPTGKVKPSAGFPRGVRKVYTSIFSLFPKSSPSHRNYYQNTIFYMQAHRLQYYRVR